MNKNAVFVLNTNKKPCNPVHPAVARKLLTEGKAAVFQRYPFTIILKEESKDETKELRVKIDPGAKTTGLAIVSDTNVVWCAELEHRGFQVREKLNDRRILRRGRRGRKTRYRKPRFREQKATQRMAGSISDVQSLQHRILGKKTMSISPNFCY